jgi:hypothetical protein
MLTFLFLITSNYIDIIYFDIINFYCFSLEIDLGKTRFDLMYR